MLTFRVEDEQGGVLGVVEFNGGMCTFGRGEGAQRRVEDPAMAEVHFALFEHGGSVFVRDLQGWGATLVNGAAVFEAPLSAGDLVRAGRTHFRVTSPGLTEIPVAEEPDDPDAPMAMYQERWRSLHDTVRWTLLGEADPLYAVVDVARDASLPELVLESGEMSRCLIPDIEEADLVEEAPYLVALRPASPLLRALLDGWGLGWGVFLTSARPFNELFPFLQDLHFTLRNGENPWRFFEPAALLERLASLGSAGLGGPVSAWLVEDATESTLVRACIQNEAVACERIPVAG